LICSSNEKKTKRGWYPLERTSDVIVVGAGIVGSVLAYLLAHSGRSVRMLDRGLSGGEASGARAGLLTTVAEGSGKGPYLDLSVQGLAEMRTIIQQLEEETGIDCWLECHPLYRIATNEQERDMMFALYQERRQLGGQEEWLEPEQVRREQPLLSPRVTGAMRSPQEYHVTPGLLLKAVLQAARQRGVLVQENTAVTAFLTEGQRVIGVAAGMEHYYAEHVILANGAWSPELLKLVGIDLPVTPLRGQMLVVSLAGFALPCLINTARGYLVPKKDGRIVVGATQEHAGFAKEITVAGITHLLKVLSAVPALVQARIHDTFVGLRPMSSDGMPLIGPLPGWEGLHVATGHAQHGILLSGITGRMMTAYLNGEDPGELWRHFQVQRVLTCKAETEV
jgi:glycine oxidase